MKKLMIAAAIVCAACFANAAAVAWTIDSIYAPGAGGSGWGAGMAGGAGYNVQLIVGTGLDNGVITGVINDWVDDLGAFSNGYMENYSESDSMLENKDYYAQVVITYGDSTLASQIGTINAATFNEGVAEPFISTVAGRVANFSGITVDPQYGAFSAAGWQSVPEPTSGLLLLLGVAGLALRRRRG